VRPLTTAVSLSGVPYYAYYLPLLNPAGDPIGMLAVAFPNVRTVAATYAVRQNLIYIGIASLIFVAIVMLLYTIALFRPLVLLADNLNEIANGYADLTKRLPVAGNDEIAKASGYFNQTIERFSHLITSIKNRAGELSDIGNDLASNMTETASAMNEIASNIQSIKGRVPGRISSFNKEP